MLAESGRDTLMVTIICYNNLGKEIRVLEVGAEHILPNMSAISGDVSRRAERGEWNKSGFWNPHKLGHWSQKAPEAVVCPGVLCERATVLSGETPLSFCHPVETNNHGRVPQLSITGVLIVPFLLGSASPV